MATFGKYDTIPGLVAYGDLSSSQYLVVQAASTAGQVKVATTAATDPILGVLQNDPASGEAAEVAFAGICKVKAAASVTYGAPVTTNSTGQVAVTTTDGDQIVGIAMEASDTAGDIIRLVLARFHYYAA